MEENFIPTLIKCYFIAFGVLAGGSFIGSIGAFLVGEPPITTVTRLAKSLRIWAIVAAIGGTFDAISTIERGLFEGGTIDAIKQISFIISAMAGVQSAILFIEWFSQEEIT
ncbi:YtrH family sporulation protein [Salirhabdus sp. Marseille-P4669]|uniref:YtrH family sporulation protein n=1 Tax=Salirhabdus sp. Marseille-P4669 TaxID=2042310 RepID=UPI00135B13FA|nr:YtrH family sporulation protein [Salirhabdus sp. Marseille-P4669]